MKTQSQRSRIALVFVLAIFCWRVTVSAHAAAGQPERVSLAGKWRFELDRGDKGVAEGWCDRRLADRIELPGALQNQGYGDEISVQTEWTANIMDRSWFTQAAYEKYRQPGNVKVPFWLQPDRHYVGVAWYQRDIEIRRGWEDRRVTLSLERPHWETRVWFDGKPLGTNDSLSTAHVYDLGVGLASGKHTLTVRVDNRLIVNVGVWAHSVSDHTQGNWNGIVGRIELSAGSPVWIEDAQAYPDFDAKTARVAVVVGRRGGAAVGGDASLSIGGQAAAIRWDGERGRAELALALGEKAVGWDEFSPELQRVPVRVTSGSGTDERVLTFGLRQISTTADRFLAVNGRKTFLRGTLECCIFPLTGYPPTDVASWRRIVRICQAHGLNHIRFHSWCPPEAAFEAADEAGFYYQVEIAAWTRIGDGEPVDAWLYKEAERVLKAYGNHPSFLLMPYGNEPDGPKQKEWLGRWVDHWKQTDPRRLYTSGSGWPVLAENQYHVNPGPRGQWGWGGKDYAQAVKDYTVPTIVHEMGQWCVYPNFDEMRKYRGPLKPKNFEIFRDTLEASGLLGQARDFLRASGKLQTLCYKEEIEGALRTPGVSGVQLLDLHDFPGQGSALVGVLDPFWDSKGYVKPEEFRRFYDTAVPLSRMTKRVWTSDETLRAPIELAHFGAAPLSSASAWWDVRDAGGRRVAGDRFQTATVPIGRGFPLGEVVLPLGGLRSPGAYRLSVGVSGTRFHNDWNFWVYPSAGGAEVPTGVEVVTSLDDAVLGRLEQGAKVVLLTALIPGSNPRNFFTPVFWNRQWFPSQACQTLGLLCDPRHPMLAAFPTEFHSDWQWEGILGASRAMVMTEFPRELKPIVQVIDDWNSNRKLGLAFECVVGGGSLLVCSADLSRGLEGRPAARQLRASILAYAASSRFHPRVAVAGELLKRLLGGRGGSNLVKLGAKVLEADSEDAAYGNLAVNAIDGDPETFWHTRWSPSTDPMPHWIVIDLGREVDVAGLRYLPRQDMARGRVRDCDVLVATQPGAWSAPVANAVLENKAEDQTLTFPSAVRARYLKIIVKSEAERNPFASVAEFDIVPAKP